MARARYAPPARINSANAGANVSARNITNRAGAQNALQSLPINSGTARQLEGEPHPSQPARYPRRPP